MIERKEKKVILHINTDQRSLETLQQVSDKENIRVVSTDNGQDGLDMAREMLPDLVIIKKEAPMLDALSFSVLFRQSRSTSSIPVLVICSGVNADEQEMFLDAGCNGCIAEPFTLNDLTEKIRRWI